MAITTTGTWQFTEHKRESFTYDDIIDAYIKGKKEASKENLVLIKEKLKENLKKAGKQTSEVISKLKDKKIEVHAAHLKIYNWNEVEVLFIVPQAHFLDPGFLKAYEIVTELEKQYYEGETYSITFSFVDNSENLDKNKIESDGFILEHKMNQQ